MNPKQTLLCGACGLKLVEHFSETHSPLTKGICEGCGANTVVEHHVVLHDLKMAAAPIRQLIGKILGCSPTKPAFQWTIGLVTNKTKTKGDSVQNVKLTNEQKVKISVAPVDGAGKPATVDGKPQWSYTGASQLAVADDGLSAELTSSDAPETGVITVTADADLGEGVENIVDTVNVVVEAAKAENLGLSVGAPENK